MKIPSSEVDWLKLVGSPKGVRSLFAPTDVVSFFYSPGNGSTWVIYEYVPYKDIPLTPFRFEAIPGKRFAIGCELRCLDHTSGNEVSRVYKVNWRSFYLNKKSGFYHFSYRPNAVFLVVPGIGSIPLVPYEPWPYARAKNMLLFGKDGTSRYPFGLPAKKYGFSSNPSTPTGPKVKTETVYDAAYHNGAQTSFTSRTIEVFRKEIISVKTPNFFKLKPGKYPVNPWSSYTIETVDGPGLAITESISNPSFRDSQFFGSSAYTYFTPPSFVYDTNVRNKAISTAEERASTSIAANIAQDIVQFGQLKRLVATTTKRIGTSVRKLDAKDYDGAIHALGNYSQKTFNGIRKVLSPAKTTAQNWLELQYAWKPLIKDVEGLIKILNRSLEHNPPIRTVRSRSKVTKRYTKNQGPYLPGQPLVPMEIVEEHSARIVLRYRVSDQLRSNVQQLGFANPINLAYEVIPFSFVVDWFLPIGPYLESISAWQGMVFIDGSLTESLKQNVSTSFDQTAEVAALDKRDRKAGSFRQKTFLVARTKLSTFPRKELPRFKNPVSLTHALNGIALVVSGFKTRYR